MLRLDQIPAFGPTCGLHGRGPALPVRATRPVSLSPRRSALPALRVVFPIASVLQTPSVSPFADGREASYG
jgi:hypothetical protein